MIKTVMSNIDLKVKAMKNVRNIIDVLPYHQK